MKTSGRHRTRPSIPIHFLTLVLLIVVPQSMPADESTGTGTAAPAEKGPPPCSAPGAREFDFWIGDWELSWEAGHGTNRVEKILGGCVIHEQFDGSGPGGNGLVGRSYSTYSPDRRSWRQTWVDNEGGYLDFDGGMQGDQMVMSRTARRDGETFLQRMVWHNIGADTFDWNCERSDDGGKTWKPVWKVHYTRRK